MPVDLLTMVGRILLAAALGFVIGLERERHGRAAGLRTCMLVATAGALLMGLSLHMAEIFAAAGVDSAFRLDPGRLPSYAIAGMGFLGAGAIIQGRSTAVGVTTAAALWTCTGLGLAVGAGYYWPALTVAAVALFILTVLRRAAAYISHEQYVTLEVECHGGHSWEKVHALLDEYRATVRFAGREHCLGQDKINASFDLTIRSGKRWAQLLEKLEETPGVGCYSWQESKVP